MIELIEAGVSFDDWIFRKVNLQFHKGKIYGIIGKSGAGKTTLLKSIAGLLDLAEGEVQFDGKTLLGPSVKLIPGYEDIQLVNQDFALELFHTVEENIKEKILHLHKEERTELIDELLSLIELDDIRDRQARYLSGGEQQRLSIARALACEPQLLLLDEPFVHLDQRMRIKIQEYILNCHEELNMTVIMISHDGSELMGFADQIIHLENGEINRVDATNKMYYLPASRSEGELMGIINEVELNGSKVLFRPNEYSVGGDLELKFEEEIDTGVVRYSYFKTNLKEEVILASFDNLADVKSISVVKHGQD